MFPISEWKSEPGEDLCEECLEGLFVKDILCAGLADKNKLLGI